MPPRQATTVARYDQTLRFCRDKKLPPGAPRPCPTSQSPPENVRLLEQYQAWLLGGGTAEHATQTIYLPMAGHVLGLNPVPDEQIDLESDFERAMEYVRAKGVGSDWLDSCRNAAGLEKFAGVLAPGARAGEPSRFKPFDIGAHTRKGLPRWLVSELERYQRLQQKNWPTSPPGCQPAWLLSKYTQLWRFLCQGRAASSAWRT